MDHTYFFDKKTEETIIPRIPTYNSFDCKVTKDSIKVLGGTIPLPKALINKIEDNDKTKGAAIGVTVTYKEGTGIYGNATWGGDNNPLAVAERIYGEDRYDTAIQVAEELRETLSGKRFKAVVVADGRDFTDALYASGDEFADALTGGALAAINDKPLLLVNEYNTVEAS